MKYILILLLSVTYNYRNSCSFEKVVGKSKHFTITENGSIKDKNLSIGTYTQVCKYY